MAKNYSYSYVEAYYEYFVNYDFYLIEKGYSTEKSNRIQKKIEKIIEENLVLYPDMFELAKGSKTIRKFIVEDHIIYYKVNHEQKEIYILHVQQDRQNRFI